MNKEEFTQRVLEAESSLYRVSKSILSSESDCEDAVQEAILTSYEKLSTLKEEKYFKTWLTRILINICFRTAKKRQNIISFEEYMPDRISENIENLSDVKEAIMSLPIKIRTVIVLYYVEGYSVEEIGYMMKIPIGTVKSRLHKGRKLLKEQLDDADL